MSQACWLRFQAGGEDIASADRALPRRYSIVTLMHSGLFYLKFIFKKSICKRKSGNMELFVSQQQNGVVSIAPEMFRLRSCVRRKRDSIDKRFCFDIEVVER